MKIKNQDLIQSYIITTAKYNFSVYEKRILYRIIEHLQKYTKGIKLNNKYSINQDLFGDYLLTLDLKSFLTEKDKNYNRVKEAFIDLRGKTFEYETGENWEIIGIIETPKIEGMGGSYDSIVKFRLNEKIFNAFLDFSKGFRKYELKTAMEFESTYSMRFYELFSGKSAPITYAIETLKDMFGIQGKYKQNSDFIKYVIMNSQKELIKKSPYAFQYNTLKTGRKITHIEFKPFYIEKNRDPKLEIKAANNNTSLRWTFSKETLQFLKSNLKFDENGIKNNRQLLDFATQHQEWNSFNEEILQMIEDFEVQNKPGFFIKQWQKKLNYQKSKDVESIKKSIQKKHDHKTNPAENEFTTPKNLFLKE